MTWKAWRRKPSAGACDWCLMLAMRGAVYKSERTARSATDGWHAHCHCGVELETDIDARTAVRIHPADANRIIEVRPKTGDGRTYRYDLRQFTRLDDTLPQPKFRPAGRAPHPKPTVRAWSKLGKDDVAALFAADSQRARALAKTAPDPDKYTVYTAGPVQVRVAQTVKWTETEIAALQSKIDQVLAALPGEVMGVDVTGRRYVIWLNGDAGRIRAYGYTARGFDHVWLNPKLLRRALTESGDIDRQGDYKMPCLATTDQLTYTLTHELGHTMDLAFEDKSGSTTGVLDPLKGFTLGRIRKDRAVKDLLKKVLAGDFGDSTALSGYGRSEGAEAHAEAFAEWVHGDRANPVALAFAKEFGWVS